MNHKLLVQWADAFCAAFRKSIPKPMFMTALMAATVFTQALAQTQTEALGGQPAAKVSEQEAHAIGVDAYLYFYPLVTMDITRKQSTNIEPGKEFGKGPMNMFVNVPAYPPADLKVVVRINFDTLYSIAWLDLTKEAAGRLRAGHGRTVLPPADARHVVGRLRVARLADDRHQGGQFPRHPARLERDGSGGVHAHSRRRLRMSGSSAAPRRTDAADYPAVHKIQAGYKVTPLSRWGKAPEPVAVKIDPSVDMKTPPKTQVDTMPADKYFTYAAELLKLHPPHITDQPIIAQMKRIGIEPGKSFDFDKLDPAVKKALESAPEEAQRLMTWKVATLARVANGWSMNTDTMGVYGNYYLKRAIVAQLGLGANLPEDAIYPLNLFDDTGKPLDGANKYTIHFDKGATPPVNAFWSITLYDSEGFQVANVLNRFAVSSYMPFKTNADGSLDLYFQNESPGKDKEANWLPAPKGPFNLCMRLYGPKTEALTGKWNPPAVKKVQ